MAADRGIIPIVECGERGRFAERSLQPQTCL